jgi:chorismate mutase
MGEPQDDPVVRELRASISELDRTIFDAVRHRLALVARLKKHKRQRGYSFVDPQREAEMVAEQLAANQGPPLSEEGLRSFYAELLALTKREVERGEGEGSD